jgi:hypothetical protein
MNPLGDADLEGRLVNHRLGGAPVIRAVQALRTCPNDLSEDLNPLGESSRFFCLEVALGLIEDGANCKRVLEFCRGIRLMLQGKQAWLALKFPSLDLGLEGIHSELDTLLQSYCARSRSPDREMYARRARVLRPVVKALEEARKRRHYTGSLDWS